MKTSPPLLMVPFREVRHDQPEDCLHYEPVAVRGQLHHWTIPAHRHEGLHQFQFLERGGATATIDGDPHAVTAPAVLMLAPGSVHGFVYAPESCGHQITLPSAALRSALAGAAQLEPQLDRSFVLSAEALGEDVAECAHLFEALSREFHGSSSARVQALMAYATLIALWFLRQNAPLPAEARRHALRDTLVQRFRTLVESGFRQHQPLSAYASALNVTPDHLSRSCRSVTGQSALDLVHERLMVEARRLLSYTQAPVAGIARELGYEDPAYFSKFFGRAVGMSPSAYRESVHAGTRMAEPARPPVTRRSAATARPLHGAGPRHGNGTR
jgi:AraC family transcriptional regulator, transcriptional activator of pobA